MVNKYEAMFIINTALEEEGIKNLVEKFKTMIEKSGTVESVDEWGKKKLAYPINYITEGYYVLVNFSAESSFPQELERVFKITDGIIKYLVIKKEE